MFLPDVVPGFLIKKRPGSRSLTLAMSLQDFAYVNPTFISPLPLLASIAWLSNELECSKLL
jgi:hypothetical protein